jgi:hypothetical protein
MVAHAMHSIVSIPVAAEAVPAVTPQQARTSKASGAYFPILLARAHPA